jgi:hypothetical protein
MDFIDECANDRRTVFAPGLELAPDLWRQITILPGAISKLTSVEHLLLYGSHLSAIPPEIGDMTALIRFEPYASDRLHWFPYEITRCAGLLESTVSTRVLYGNPRTNATFPHLPAILPSGCEPDNCSVCRGPFATESDSVLVFDEGGHRHSAASSARLLPCLLATLPMPPEPDVNYPHLGGFERTPA